MQRANPTRIGLFVIGGLALLIAAVMVVAGGRLFASKERAVMYFSGSIYGLQMGAPVVFRGVRLGSVVGIGVVHDAASGRFEIPVVAEVDRNLIQELPGRPGAPQAALSLEALVAQGLTAQLSTQSLLTGLLYVDLDLRRGAPSLLATKALAPNSSAPSAPASAPASAPRPVRDTDGMVEIPTTETTIQALKTQLENLNLGELLTDVKSIAASTREFVSGPKLQQALDDVSRITGDLKRLSAKLERRVDPLADSVQRTLADARRSAGQLGAAADRVSNSADRVGGAADRADSVLVDSAPMLKSLRLAADELSKTATALRAATAEDSSLLNNVERATQDVSRASRAVRELADLLEREPQALIRGKAAAP